MEVPKMYRSHGVISSNAEILKSIAVEQASLPNRLLRVFSKNKLFLIVLVQSRDVIAFDVFYFM